MVAIYRVFAFAVMVSIVLFALIHLGVSIGIIVPARQYDDIYRPQIGLSSFNLVVGLFGLITGILGLVSMALNSSGFGKIVAIISCLLALFALASLVSALVINAKSLEYVSSHFSMRMSSYETDAKSRTIVNLIQSKRQCCGENIWLDWSRFALNQSLSPTPTVTSTTTFTSTTMATATSSTTTTTTTTTAAAVVTTTTTTAATAVVTVAPTTTTTTAVAGGRSVRDIETMNLNEDLSPSISLSRRKRQASGTYGGIPNLPLTFSVILPGSCCASNAVRVSNDTNAYCISNANGTTNNFYQIGCSKSLDYTAGNQAMGIGVINSCMFILAVIAVPFMLKLPGE